MSATKYDKNGSVHGDLDRSWEKKLDSKTMYIDAPSFAHMIRRLQKIFCEGLQRYLIEVHKHPPDTRESAWDNNEFFTQAVWSVLFSICHNDPIRWEDSLDFVLFGRDDIWFQVYLEEHKLVFSRGDMHIGEWGGQYQEVANWRKNFPI